MSLSEASAATSNVTSIHTDGPVEYSRRKRTRALEMLRQHKSYSEINDTLRGEFAGTAIAPYMLTFMSDGIEMGLSDKEMLSLTQEELGIKVGRLTKPRSSGGSKTAVPSRKKVVLATAKPATKTSPVVLSQRAKKAAATRKKKAAKAQVVKPVVPEVPAKVKKPAEKLQGVAKTLTARKEMRDFFQRLEERYGIFTGSWVIVDGEVQCEAKVRPETIKL